MPKGEEILKEMDKLKDRKRGTVEFSLGGKERVLRKEGPKYYITVKEKPVD